MGQCSSSTNNNGGCCMNHVVDGIISGGGGENLEMSRNDSPDPVMYDLMRKSIAATCPTYPHGSSVVGSNGVGVGFDSGGNSSKSNNKRRNGPPGQHHLLYKQNSTTTTNNNNNKTNNNSCTSDQQISSNNSTSQQNNNNQQTQLQQNGVTTPTNIINSYCNWLPNDIPPQCPTRLLIRRRSLKVVEEGGGTHIYAIRYPEDTKDTTGDSSEQTTFSTSSPRGQEQCPTPRRQPTAASNGAMASSTTTFSNTAASSATTTTTTTTGTSKPKTKTKSSQQNNNNKMPMVDGDVFTPAAMNSIPRQSVIDWVTVSEEHNIYIADAGLTALQCDYLVNKTEQACRGQYAAYTYAKQTLGCREFPILAQTSFMPVHTVVHAITQRFHPQNQNLNSSSASNNNNNNNNKDSNNNKESSNSNKTNKQSNQPILLQLDDREPHIVKYDVTKKERQKLDMHTDKSEWTFLIALSNGCGVDYEGGGTYFECLDATVHIQRGHALIFPGKLRHCGQKITSGLRFLLVGFLVDKTNGNNNNNNNANSNTNNNNNSGGGNNGGSGSTNKNSNKSNNNNNSGSTTPPSPPGVPPMRQIYENK